MVSARLLSCMLVLLCLCACGGGGGAGDGGAGNGGGSPVSISFSTTDLSFQAQSLHSGMPPSQTITATLSGSAPQSALYILVEVANPDIVTVTDVRVTNQTQGQATVVPAQAGSVGTGEHTTSITVRACLGNPTCSAGEINGSPRTIAVRYTVPSNVQGDTVSPNVVAAHASGEVILRGRNFRESTTVTIAGTAATARFVSSSELRVQYPALSAGRHAILLDSGAVAFSGELIAADIPTFAAATVPLPGASYPFYPFLSRTILYDAQRQALLLLYWPFDGGGHYELTRITYSAGTWTQGSVVALDGNARQIALTPDGSRVLLLAARGPTGGANQMLEIDPETLHVLTTTDLQLTGTARTFAIMNDGNAVITSDFPGSGRANPQLYSLRTRTLVTALEEGSDAAVVGSSDDGSTALLLDASLVYEASSGRFTRSFSIPITIFQGDDWNSNPLPPSLSRDGAKALKGPAVLAGRGGTLGTLDIASNQVTGVINKRGTRVYTIDSANLLHTFDISGSPTNGRFPEIGSAVALPNNIDLGDLRRIAVSPDDRTLFIAGEYGVRVQPAPGP